MPSSSRSTASMRKTPPNADSPWTNWCRLPATTTPCAPRWCRNCRCATDPVHPYDRTGDPMDLNLTGKHALVCGGSEGIGRATAHELALLGADVTVLSRRPEALQQVAAALPLGGAQAHGWIAADVADATRLKAQVEALAAGKPVHILVNNTGGPPGGPANAADAAAFLDAFNRHLIAGQ